MFGFIKRRHLLEQKKMLWQNFYASKEMLKTFERRQEDEKSLFFRKDNAFDIKVREETSESIETVKEIYKESYNLFESKIIGDVLPDNELKQLFRNNKRLREIYDYRIKVDGISLSFDVFASPAYGWDKALKDW